MLIDALKDLKIKICAAHEVLDEVPIFKPDCVISFDTPLNKKYYPEDASPVLAEEIPEKGTYWNKNQLLIRAFDVEIPGYHTAPPPLDRKIRVTPPRLKQITKARDFLLSRLKKGKETRLLVNCAVGVSRSTALSLGFIALLGPDLSEKSCVEQLLTLRPQASPNLAIVSYWDDLLERRGKLYAAVEHNPHIIDNRACYTDTTFARRNGLLEEIPLPELEP